MATTIQVATPQVLSGYNPAPLLPIILENVVLSQAVFAVAEFGVADLIADGAQSTAAIAAKLNVDENSLYRILRLLASQGIFCETTPRNFANTAVSNCLRSDGPMSLRAMARFRGSHFLYGTFGGFSTRYAPARRVDRRRWEWMAGSISGSIPKWRGFSTMR